MESKQRRNFAVLSRAHRRPSRRDTRQRLKREKKKKGKNENLAKRSRNFKLYIFTLPWQFIRFRWSSRGFALMGNEFNGRGMQFAIPRPYYSKTLSLFYSTVDNPRLSLMFRSFPLIFFFFPFLFYRLLFFISLLLGSSLARSSDQPTTHWQLTAAIFLVQPIAAVVLKITQPGFRYAPPRAALELRFAALFRPFRSQSFYHFSFSQPFFRTTSRRARARTEANKSETNLEQFISTHQFISRDIKLGSSKPVSISRYNFLRRITFLSFLYFSSFSLFFFNRRNERRFADRFSYIKLQVQR